MHFMYLVFTCMPGGVQEAIQVSVIVSLVCRVLFLLFIDSTRYSKSVYSELEYLCSHLFSMPIMMKVICRNKNRCSNTCNNSHITEYILYSKVSLILGEYSPTLDGNLCV